MQIWGRNRNFPEGIIWLSLQSLSPFSSLSDVLLSSSLLWDSGTGTDSPSLSGCTYAHRCTHSVHAYSHTQTCVFLTVFSVVQWVYCRHELEGSPTHCTITDTIHHHYPGLGLWEIERRRTNGFSRGY